MGSESAVAGCEGRAVLPAEVGQRQGVATGAIWHKAPAPLAENTVFPH